MKKFSVIARLDDKSCKLKEQLIEKLNKDYIYDEIEPDFCFAIGGDGTFLYAVHHYLEQLDHLQFVGIHTGTLGFFSDYKEEDLEECVQDFKTKTGQVQTFGLLKCITDQNEEVYALNEIRVETLSRAQLIDIYINDVFFETFRGNGILVCTQIGSTAYNRSLGGAIIDDGVPCIEMMEIAGINHQKYPTCNSPIIFSKDTKIKLVNKYFKDVTLLYDQFETQLNEEKEVAIELSNKLVQVLRFKETPYLTRIKSLF